MADDVDENDNDVVRDADGGEPRIMDLAPTQLITEEEARQLFIAQFVGLPRATALKQLKIRGTEFCDIAAGRRILRPQILKRMGLYKVIRYAHINGKGPKGSK